MSAPINDGGPAFPRLYPRSDEDGRQGMSLRDWFAGQALAGTLAGETILRSVDENNPKVSTRIAVSAYAYAVADAMLAARSKPTP